MTPVESLATILQQMGALSAEAAKELCAHCNHCNVKPGQSCGACPADDLVARLVVAEGAVDATTLAAARRLQEGLRDARPSQQLRAAAALARAGREATSRCYREVQDDARFIVRKSNPKGYPAVTLEVEA